MASDPRESWSESDPERTYQAFESSEGATDRGRERDRSPETPGETGKMPGTTDGPRTRRSGSGYRSGSSFIAQWDDENAIPVDEDGNLFGKYRVIYRLGGGGMGSVWLVEHIGLKQQRALKVIKADVAQSETNRLRFQQEAIILAKMSRHPNAVVVYDTGFVGKFAYIDMDYQEGQTLRQRLDETGPMPVGDVLWILGEICAVLGEAHRQKIVHRDIKPQNVMIVPDPSAPRGERVKVLDFGIAKIVHEVAAETYATLTQDSMGVLGTIPYSSPEQLGLLETGGGPVAVDYRSDIYSLGVLLYEMLAGTRPFTGTQAKIFYDHAHTPPRTFVEAAPAVDVPSAVESVVRRCLEKDPADRPQSIPELFESFRRAVGVEPTLDTIPPPVPRPPTSEEAPAARPIPSFLERLRPFLSRRRRAIGGGLAAAAAILGVLAFLGPSLRGKKPGASLTDAGTTRPQVTPPVPTLRPVPPSIIAWLQARGWEPDPQRQEVESDWPGQIVRTSGEPRRRMVLNGSFYLPTDFEASSASATGDSGLPKVLKSTKSGRRFVLLDGGRFLMGNFNQLRSKDQELPFERDEEPGHWVTLSSFYMQATEVSIDEFERFCTATSKQRTDPAVEQFFGTWQSIAGLKRVNATALRDHPATGISRRMALEYARWIGGDLPTEAQWEFAARSRGEPRRFVWGNDEQRLKSVARMANVANPGGPTQVDLEENPDRTVQGIGHMAGNVREWTRDAWGIYLDKEQTDPLRTPDEADMDPYYTIRGGSYATETETARTTWRSGEGSPGFEYKLKGGEAAEDLGFRVVLEILECPKDPGAQPRATVWRETRR